MDDLKKEVRDFWDEASCGERLLLDASDKSGYLAQIGKRYSLEPFIDGFTRFEPVAFSSASGLAEMVDPDYFLETWALHVDHSDKVNPNETDPSRPF